MDTAADSLEAVTKLRGNQSYDLVITDLDMPGMDGFELLKYMKMQLMDIPSIIVTGVGEKTFPDEFKSIENTPVIKKPLDVKELLKAIKDKLEVTP